eukprot:jgi/Chrzof1/12694/Cz07g04090.t1
MMTLTILAPDLKKLLRRCGSDASQKVSVPFPWLCFTTPVTFASRETVVTVHGLNCMYLKMIILQRIGEKSAKRQLKAAKSQGIKDKIKAYENQLLYKSIFG